MANKKIIVSRTYRTYLNGTAYLLIISNEHITEYLKKNIQMNVHPNYRELLIV